MSLPDLNEHVEAVDAGIPDGVYRVVGRDDGRVTLLRVGDADARRVHAGRVVTVGAEAFDALAPAPNPDGNRSVGDALASTVETGYRSVRTLASQLVSNPLPAGVAVGLVLCGAFGERFVPLPDAAFGGFVIVGSLALAYVGSGRPSR
jgi:hypothetical protein